MVNSGATIQPVQGEYSTPFGAGAFIPSNASLVDEGIVDPSQLSGSLACKACHAEIYEQWSESMHRYAATDPHVDTGIRWFQRENGVESGRFCAGCHNPIGLLSGQYDPATTHEEIGTPPANEGSRA